MKIFSLVWSSAALFCLGGVVGVGLAQDAAPPRTPEAVRAQLAAHQNAAAQTAQAYRAMDNATLLTKLMAESMAKREAFNSPAYRELQGRRDVDAAALVSSVRQMDNGNALLPLLLLRKLDGPAYFALPAGERAAVLTDALRGAVMFNAWGLPGIYLEDASQALLEAGSSAVPALTRLLSDTRPAPVFGSQQYMVYKRYQFRLCDYALFFLERLRGQEDFIMPAAVDERDRLIREMLDRR
jgi:hypothetical protein